MAGNIESGVGSLASGTGVEGTGGSGGWSGECALPLYDEVSCVARSDETSEGDESSCCRDESPCLFLSRAERLGSVEGLSRRRLLSSPEGFPLRTKRVETERSLPFRFRG